ncbi:hypothetical protein NVP1081O_189 [Vibrio phage 1.081.O._10N.286.52.C2]|nr:hypothetical protein NVP1081O_189 [Vibrio phage 1.081.O._10N.286.52.C2]
MDFRPAIQAEFRSHTDYLLPVESLERLNIQIQEQCPEWGYIYTDGCLSLDTGDRDFLFDLIAVELGASAWPCNGDSDEVKVAFADCLSVLEKV